MEKRWLANRRSDVVVALVRLIHLDHGIWKRRRRRRRQGGGSVFYSQIFPGIVFLLITSLSNNLYLANLINRKQLLIFYRRFHIYPIIDDAIHLRHNCDFSLTTSLSTSHLERFIILRLREVKRFNCNFAGLGIWKRGLDTFISPRVRQIFRKFSLTLIEL